MKMKAILILSGASFLAMASAARAQDASTAPVAGDEAVSERASTEMMGPQDIVVTARKRAESLQKVPVAISAMTGDMLRESGVASTFDIQREVPGLTLLPATADRSALQLSIRGQFQSEVLLTIDSSVGIYIDGVNVPRSFGLSPALTDLARLEVLKGPQGTLYGRNTTGGAITLNTVRPDYDGFNGFADVKIGNFGLLDMSGAINVPMADRMAVRLVGRTITSDGFGRDSNGVKLGNQDQQYFRLSWKWDATDNLRFDFTGDYTKIDDGGPSATVLYRKPYPPQIARDQAGNPILDASGNPRLDNVPLTLREIAAESGLLPSNAANLLAASAIWDGYVRSTGRASTRFFDSATNFAQYIKTEIYGLGLNTTFDLSDSVSLKSTTGYRHVDRETAVDADGIPFHVLEVTFPTVSKFFSQELNLSYESDRIKAVLGGYYGRETGSDGTQSIIAPLLNPGSPQRNIANIKNKSVAVYAQATYSLTDRLNFTGGIRYTSERKGMSVTNTRAGNCALPVSLLPVPTVCRYDSSHKYTNVSYLASIDYTPADDILLYVKTSQGFRGGGENLRGTTLVSLQSFKPEKAVDYEAGIKAEFFDRRLRTNAAVYHTNYRNIQRSVTVSDLNGATATIVTNAAKASIDGFELEVFAYPAPGLTLGGAFTYIDAKYKKFIDLTGDRSKEVFPVPEKTFSVSARYEHPTSFGSAAFRADYQWQDDLNLVPRAYIISSVTQKAYGLLNGRFELKFDNPEISVALYGRNITNKHYYSSGVDFDAPFTGLGGNIGYKGEPRTYGVELRKTF